MTGAERACAVLKTNDVTHVDLAPAGFVRWLVIMTCSNNDNNNNRHVVIVPLRAHIYRNKSTVFGQT